ncbi:MAG: outer membrane protein transport protein [Gemmatimonadaceae bacterium]
MTLDRASRYTLTLALLGMPAIAGAQAFGLNEIGSCAVARGFAVTGMPCDDASSIYWNPGASSKTKGLSVYAGAAIIALKADFTRDTSFRRYEGNAPTAVVPHVFLSYKGAGKLGLGLGVYVPYGLTSQWGDDFPGRFAATKASLQTIYIQPNATWQLTDNWSIGGGPVIGHSTVELIQAVDLSSQFAQPNVTFGNLGIPKYTEFARANLKGSAMAYGFNLGIQGKLATNWEAGARVLSQLTFAYDDADATFTQSITGLTLAANNPLGAPAGTPVDALLTSQFTGTGALTSQKVKTEIQHPAQVQAGVGYKGFKDMTLSLDYAYVGWKSFKSLPVDFQGAAPDRSLQEDYNNTSSIRFGAERRFDGGAALRVGLAAAASAAPPETVTPLLPEQDRRYGMIGGHLPLFSGLGLDGTYMRVSSSGSRGRIDERGPAQSTQTTALLLNSGVYNVSANVWSFSVKYAF